MGDPNAQTNAQMQAQAQQTQMAQMQAQMQVGQMGGMHAPPVVLIPGQPVTTAQIAAQARPPPAEMTLAQIAAQQNAEAAAKKTAKPKKTPKAKAAKKEAVGAGNAPPAAPPGRCSDDPTYRDIYVCESWRGFVCSFGDALVSTPGSAQSPTASRSTRRAGS